MDDAFILTRARLCAHYFHHRAWLDDGTLLRNAYKLTGVQGFLCSGKARLARPSGDGLRVIEELARQSIDDFGRGWPFCK